MYVSPDKVEQVRERVYSFADLCVAPGIRVPEAVPITVLHLCVE